jgi:uncharacterized protein (TIGR03435 family)
VKISGNRINVRGFASIRGLLMYAYNVDEHQISASAKGGVWDEFYDIAAKAPGERPLTTEDVRLMFQSLLTDRFQLKLHHDRAEISVYNLVVGKNGSKLKKSKPDTESETINKNAAVTRESIRMKFTNRSISELIRWLLIAVRDRPVVDKTGLTGSYDFEMEWWPDTPGTPFGSSLIDAMRDQLGLRLEAAKEPMERLVVESVQRPSEN